MCMNYLEATLFFLWIIPHFGKYFVKCPNQSSSLWWAVRRWHVDTKVKRCPQLKIITFPHNDCTFSQLHTFSTCFFFLFLFHLLSFYFQIVSTGSHLGTLLITVGWCRFPSTYNKCISKTSIHYFGLFFVFFKVMVCKVFLSWGIKSEETIGNTSIRQ